MPRKITMTSEESALFQEVNKLVKRANQRLLRMERATGEKGSYSAKELYDRLSSDTLNAVTSGGRISMKKSYNVNQLRAIKTATEKYLHGISTVPKAKKYTKEVSEKSGVPLDLKGASTIFQLKDNYEWIYEYYKGSDFWAEYGNPVIKKEMNQPTFLDSIFKDIKQYQGELVKKQEEGEDVETDILSNLTDEDLKKKIMDLYIYVASGQSEEE
jgi:hypothetical protein